MHDQNPQKHGFVKDFREWKYSSDGLLLDGKCTLLAQTKVMKWFGSREDYVSLHQQWMGEARAKWFTGGEDD